MPTFRGDKFNELVLYIANRSAEDENFGRTKLAKLLMFSDFGYYAETKQPMTGATYRRKPYGPLAMELRKAERDLAAAGRAHVEDHDRYGKDQKRLVPEDDADMSAFSRLEMVIIDAVIAKYRNEPAGYLSNLSHEAPGWRIAKDDEVIPYDSVFIGEPTEADVRRGQQLAALHGWE